MGYAIHYDSSDGQILSLTVSEYASAGDWIVSALPPNFSTSGFRVKLGDPLYLIHIASGYAYNENGQRVVSADESGVDSDSTYTGEIEPRDITLGDLDDEPSGGSSGDSSGGTSGSTSGGTSGGTSEDDTEDDSDEVVDLTGVSSTKGILVNVRLKQENWVLDTNTNEWVRAIYNPAITKSTVLHVTGVNRQVLTAHVYWEAADEVITFHTASRPSADLLMNGVLSETGDDWTAKGVVEAWPGAGLVSKRFRQSLNADDWSVTLSARGTDGDTKTILTSVGFANAQLLFATPEWTGNTHVVIPSVFVHDEYQRLCYTLTNLSDYDVTITEVSLRLLYNGTVSNLTEEAQDSAALSGYITNVDIDELS